MNNTRRGRHGSDPADKPDGLDSRKVEFLMARVLQGCDQVTQEPDWAWLMPRERDPDTYRCQRPRIIPVKGDDQMKLKEFVGL